jgi:glycosyltransferase involved in cell wall biosynthesis
MDPIVRKSCVLIFVGPETDSGELNRLNEIKLRSPDQERIIFAGPSQNPEDWIRASDLFLSCSEFEGMPLSPIEAIGSGIPAVLSQIAGHEFLFPYSEHYSLVHPEHGAKCIEGIINQIKSNYLNYRLSLWERTQTIRTQFTLSAMSKQYEKLYERRK